MYIPPSFRIDDAAKLSAFMNAHSFATLVTCKDSVPFATHLPIRHFCENGVCTTLVSHMAKANPQWQHFSPDSEVLAIFTGPHAYISPSWYATATAVPTWNYTASHVYGFPALLTDHAKVVSLLEETVSFYERTFAQPWPGTLPDDLRDNLIRSIVAFEIRVTRIEGKFKLGQNRSAADIDGVYAALAASKQYRDRELSDVMASEGLAIVQTESKDDGEPCG
jgi:transcriptional regulator